MPQNPDPNDVAAGVPAAAAASGAATVTARITLGGSEKEVVVRLTAQQQSARIGGLTFVLLQPHHSRVSNVCVYVPCRSLFQSQGAVKHVLSKEQQLYYEYVTSAMRGSDATLKTAVFKSLREDDGLYQLLPYFTQFIAEEVTQTRAGHKRWARSGRMLVSAALRPRLILL